MEEYIRNNREAFDPYDPPDDLWQKVEVRLGRRKKMKVLRDWTVRVAGGLLIFALAFLFSEYLHRPAVHSRAVASLPAETQLPVEFRETQLYYETQVKTKLTEMKPYFVEYPGLKDEVNKDFYQLDSICHSLKADLRDNVANQEVIEAMIENYRTRLSMLESLLSELKLKNARHEKTRI